MPMCKRGITTLLLAPEPIMIRSRQVWGAVAISLSLMAYGRGAAAQTTAPVSGHVVFNGKPLAAGKIVFYLDDDEFVGAKIKDGRFKLRRAPAGTWRVAIESDDVPAKYRGEETSGLSVRIKAGVANQFDFELTE
jgi:hypothetical protein